MVSIGQHYKGINVSLDGGSFINCQFETCLLIFSGLLPVGFNGCTFTDCQWRFDGPAQNTMNFLRGLHSMGGGGKAVVDATIADIQAGGRVSSGPGSGKKPVTE